MLTSKGLDQENSAPDNANETQSAGVPEKKNHHQIITINDRNQKNMQK